MLNKSPFYHQCFRNSIIGFGKIFSDMNIVRSDKSTGANNQTITVPIAYGPKEKWVLRVDEQPNLESTQTEITLPRMAFEITKYEYDASRKLARSNQIRLNDPVLSTQISSFTPVPYNLYVDLTVISKTQEDAFQIVEQILPFFTPEYSISVVTVPELNQTDVVPVVLLGTQLSDTYEGSFQDRRYVTHTLSFVIKTNVYGYTSTAKTILQTTANVTDVTANSGPTSLTGF